MHDETLIRQVSRGNREALSTLALRHGPALKQFAYRLLMSHQLAEEVAQETLIRAWREAARYDPNRSRLSTWLRQIAHNLAVDLLRKQRREQLAGELSPDDPATAVTAESIVGDEENNKALTDAIAGLQERHRTALVLTYYQSLNNREVAEIMGLSVRALESLLVRARQQLRRALEDSP